MQTLSKGESLANPERSRRLWSKKVRQAIAAAIHREALIDRVFEGRTGPAYHMVPPAYPFATKPFLTKYNARDVDLSIRLLKSLGYTSNKMFEFDLWYPLEEPDEVLRVIKDQLEETGLIRLNLKGLNWVEFVHNLHLGRLPAFILGWTPDFADADNWLSPFASSTQSPDQGVNYCNLEMDDLLRRAASSSKAPEREELYRQIGELYAEEVVTIPLFWESEFIAFRPGIDGVAIGPPFEFNYNVVRRVKGESSGVSNTGSIIIGTTYEVQSLDAHDAHARSDWETLKNTGVALMSYKPGTAELVPGAAQDYPVVSDAGKTYTFTLRRDIKFADGTPLTARDYTYAWKRINNLKGQVSSLAKVYVESVEAPDDRTVVYHLHDTYGFFPEVAATPVFIPVNPNVFASDQVNRFPAKLDGIGPYRVVSYVRRGEMVLEANPHYFGDDKPNIPKVIVRYFTDSSVMAKAVEIGEIDIGWRSLGLKEAVRLMKISGVNVSTISTPLLQYLTLNHAYSVGEA
jgi:peptide/nickel transport system substrate-binding protein